MDIQIIDGLRKVSHEIASIFIGISFSENVFGVSPIYLMQPYQIEGTNIKCIYGSKGVIEFSDIHPSKIIDIHIDEPIIRNEDVHDIVLNTWNNDGSTEIKKTQHISEQHTIIETNSLATEIASEMAAKVGAEYAGFKAEISAKISAKLNMSESHSEQTQVLDETTEEIIIPAWKSVTITQKKSISDIEQNVVTHCEIDSNIRISGGSWEKKFNSLKDFNNYIRGGGDGEGTIPTIDQLALDRRFGDFHIPNFEVTVEKVRKYHNVKTGSFDRTEIDSH